MEGSAAGSVTAVETTKLEADAHALVTQAQALTVASHDEFRQAKAFVLRCKQAIEEVETAFDTELAHKAWKRICEQRRKYSAPFQQAIELASNKGAAFLAAEQQRVEAEARAAQEKAEVEQRAAAEAERKRLDAEHAEQRRIEAEHAAAAEAARKAAWASGERKHALELKAKAEADAKAAEERRKQEQAEAAQRAQEAALAPPVEVAPVTKHEGIRVMKDAYDFSIENEDQLPREYMEPNLVSISRVVKALGSMTKIPGVKVFKKAPMISVTKRK